jgi:outer membrane protein TolC
MPLALGACASVPTASVELVSAKVEAGHGAAPAYARDDKSASEIAARVETALAAPLNPQSAAALALANNPRVAAAMEGLGIAESDYLATVLPEGPHLGALRLIPDHAGEHAVLHQRAALELLGLLTLPAKIRSGGAEREAARARAALDILMIGAEARTAMIGYIAARQDADLMAQAADVADAAADTADELFAAGNIAAVERDRERLFAEEVAIANIAVQAALIPARERVNIALGLQGEAAANWQSVPRLPAPPAEPLSVPDMEAKAKDASLDLAIATGALKAAEARAGFSWLTSLLPGLSLEGEREREDGEWKQGFGIELLAPLFDLGRGERMRLKSTAAQNAALKKAVEVELAAQTRMRAANVESARQIALRRREVLLPLSSAVFEGAQKDFNAMEIGLTQLIEAKRQRLETGRAAVAAVRDYWLAQAELDLLLAGAMSGTEPGAPTAGVGPAKAVSPGH